jgi:hypothetical protein
MKLTTSHKIQIKIPYMFQIKLCVIITMLNLGYIKSLISFA